MDALLGYWQREVVPQILLDAQQQAGQRGLGDILRGFRDRMKQILLPFLERGAQAGAQTAAQEIEGLGIGIDFTLVNEDVLRWARSHGAELVTGITQTTRDQVRQAIANWIESGEPLSALEEKLAVTFGRQRAELIASTEVTRVYAEGNQRAWKESGVVTAKVWRTAEDEIVMECPICWPLNDTVVELDGEWTHPNDEILAEIGAIFAPPAHPRCRCWLAPKVMGRG